MTLVPLDASHDIPMNQVLVWKFPFPSKQPKRSLATQARLTLAEWLMEAARRIQPKNEKAGAAS
jgi:hypothetical protein